MIRLKDLLTEGVVDGPWLTRLGFDRVEWLSDHRVRIGCGACDAVTIDGLPTHAPGCPKGAGGP